MRGADQYLAHASLGQQARIFLAERLGMGSPFTRLGVEAEIADKLHPEDTDQHIPPAALVNLLDRIIQTPSPRGKYQLLAQPMGEGDQRIGFDVVEGLTSQHIIEAVANTARESLGASIRGARIADLGAGTGRLGGLLCDHSAEQVTLIDSVPELLAIAARRNDTTCAAADTLDLPFRDESFDLAISGGLVHSLGSALQSRYFGEVARILKPGGIYLDGDQQAWRGTTANWGRFQLSWLIKAHAAGPEVLGDPLQGVDQTRYFTQFGLNLSRQEYAGASPDQPIVVRILRKSH